MLAALLRQLLLPAVLVLAAAPAAPPRSATASNRAASTRRSGPPAGARRTASSSRRRWYGPAATAAGMALLPDATMPPAIPKAEVARRRSGCLDTAPGAVFAPEDDQRAELWLQSTEPPGTDRWFGFSFRIDEPGRRGQWQPAGGRPVEAERKPEPDPGPTLQGRRLPPHPGAGRPVAGPAMPGADRLAGRLRLLGFFRRHAQLPAWRRRRAGWGTAGRPRGGLQPRPSHRSPGTCCPRRSAPGSTWWCICASTAAPTT